MPEATLGRSYWDQCQYSSTGGRTVPAARAGKLSLILSSRHSRKLQQSKLEACEPKPSQVRCRKLEVAGSGLRFD